MVGNTRRRARIDALAEASDGGVSLAASAWRRLRRSPVFLIGASIIVVFVLLALLLRRRPLFIVASTIIVVLLIIAAFPSLFTSVDPTFQDLSKTRQPPS